MFRRLLARFRAETPRWVNVLQILCGHIVGANLVLVAVPNVPDALRQHAGWLAAIAAVGGFLLQAVNRKPSAAVRTTETEGGQ